MIETPSEISPRQARAGRALIAWSQTQLADAARVALSTVADFERGNRNPVANNMQAIREALEAQGVRFMAGGAVAAAQAPPEDTEPQAGQLLRWIEASDLSDWGGRRDGQGRLPELLSRLIYAARGPRAELRFPASDSITQAGWDGVCDVDAGTAYIPDGRSVWEIGAQRTGIGRKAEDDYRKRTDAPDGLDTSNTTYVFVTPQRWSAKTAWVAEKRAESVWRDVRAYDADDLVHWLETYPGVATWLAVQVGKRPDGLRELAAVWDEWSQATKTPLTAELLKIGRDEEATAILRWRLRPPSTFNLQAGSADEAMAFLYAALQPLPDADRLFWESRCLVVQSDDDARRLLNLGPKVVVVMSGGTPGLAEALVAKGHRVFAAFGSDAGSPPNVVQLPRPWRFDLEQGLEDLGLTREEAHRLASTSGRSLAALRRLMPAGPGRAPAWAAAPRPALLAAMLAGAWRQDAPADRQIVEQLAGRPYGELETDFAALAAELDGPLRRSGEVWKLASLRDTWLLVARFLSDDQVTRLKASFQAVLGTVDPAFDADPEDRWRLGVDRDDQPSPELRRGLAEAMICLGLYPSGPAGAVRAADAGAAVRTLLSNATDWVWWSLSDDFRRLAEVAPDEFLPALDDALDAPGKPLRVLFRSDDGFLHAREYLSNLMWALEMLAWSPAALTEVALILARLAEMDPGGRMSNRPSNSLRRIFLPWSPQTYASVDERTRVLDRLVQRHPKVAWATLLGLAPRLHDSSTPSPLPVWRDFTLDEPVINTWRDVHAANAQIGERLLTLAGSDPGRWRALLEHWANFDKPWRETAAVLLNAASETFDGQGRVDFREGLRDFLHKHESFPEAAWSLPAADLEPLNDLFDRLEPKAALERHAWLFTSGASHRQRGRPWQEAEAARVAAQAVAVDDIYAEVGLNGLMTFIGATEMPNAVGAAVIASRIDETIKEDLLDRLLVAEDLTQRRAAAGILFRRLQDNGLPWVRARFRAGVAAGLPVSALLLLSQSLPVTPETWDEVAAVGAELKEAYWKNLHVFGVQGPADLLRAMDELIAVGHARAALSMIGSHIEDAPPGPDLVRLLDAAKDAEAAPDDDATMFGYYLALIFKRLDEATDVSQADMVRLEWIYFQGLEHSERPPNTLHKALAEDPLFFVMLLKALYLPTPESGVVEDALEPEVVERVASQAYRVLAGWPGVPGMAANGDIDEQALRSWVGVVQRECAASGRSDIGDVKIGEVLSHARRRGDESWPPAAICSVIDEARSRPLEDGFMTGVFNGRGMTMRSPFDGGAQERQMADQFRADAVAAANWPRVRAVLNRIAEFYERDGEREDQSAEQRDW